MKIRISPAGGNQKRAGVAILVSDKTDFKPTTVKETNKIFVSLSGHAPNIRAVKYIKQILIDNKIIAGDFNTTTFNSG